MPKPGPRSTHRYSEEFKATEVRLSKLPGVAIQDVATSLYIHPFMLSRWRKEQREGTIMAKGSKLDPESAAELKELRALKKKYERLKLEHEILKKPSSALPVERRRLHVHRPSQGRAPGERHVRGVQGESQRLLRLALQAFRPAAPSSIVANRGLVDSLPVPRARSMVWRSPGPIRSGLATSRT
jgi:transposase